jgi:hypothetical protein
VSSPNTRIAEIVDQTAAIAGTIEGVRLTFGAGTGLVDDPLHPGRTIEPAPPNPTEPFTHVSDLPSSGSLPLGMVGTSILTWHIPMRFFVQAEDLAEVRMQLVAMYPRYLAALADHVLLNETARRWSTLSYRLGHDPDWAWLEMDLTVEERLNLATKA